MKIKVDRNKCSGIGLCEAMSPDYFEVDDGGLLRFVQGDDVADDVLDEIDAAVQACPTGALSRELWVTTRPSHKGVWLAGDALEFVAEGRGLVGGEFDDKPATAF
jgi:ferredoxin